MSMQMDGPAVEAAHAGDRQAMVTSFCEAFADDPGLAWLWPDRRDRLRRLPHFFRPIVAGTMRNGVALRSPNADAVSLWRKPGWIDPGGFELLLNLPSMVVAFSKGGARSRLMRDALKAHRPSFHSWWYLQFIGVRPDVQRSGLGKAVVRAGLDLARAEASPVYVEVMNPQNLGFYRGNGFETVAEFDIPKGGPHVWAMIANP